MDLSEHLREANIVRVAIVDDDLSTQISGADLSKVDGLLQDQLADLNDPDRDAYFSILREHGIDIDTLADPAMPLSNPEIRDVAPGCFRGAAERVLEDRHNSARRVYLIKDLLIASGIEQGNIHTYHEAFLPSGRYYDLIIVDYYLVQDSSGQTVSLIRGLIESHMNQEHPLQIIVMSYHVDGLKRAFRSLRPAVGTSSSRMRVLAKPENDTQLAAWKLTLEQLAMDRRHVCEVENFVKTAINAIDSAAREQSSKLWELDLQAMKLLHEVAKDDHDNFSRYIEECLSRHLLSQLEKCGDMREALELLQDRLEKHASSVSNFLDIEIDDNRAAVRDLMTSMVWRGEKNPHIRKLPEAADERACWVQATLRFGMVLRGPDNCLWLNLTQSCDLAQEKPPGLAELSLLFISGVLTDSSVSSKASRALVSMSAPMPGDEAKIIQWNIKKVYTPSVKDFVDKHVEDWKVVGELRLDQALNVAACYGAQAVRVGLQRSVRSWAVNGIAMTAGQLHTAVVEGPVSGFVVKGHAAIRSGERCEIHFDLQTYTALRDQFKGEISDASLEICRGIHVNRGRAQQKPEVYFVHCNSAPQTFGEIKDVLNNRQWLEKSTNSEKVIVVVWTV